jgi:hypothetical protein
MRILYPDMYLEFRDCDSSFISCREFRFRGRRCSDGIVLFECSLYKVVE